MAFLLTAYCGVCQNPPCEGEKPCFARPVSTNGGQRSCHICPLLPLGVCGMVLPRSCAPSAVSHLLAEGMQRHEQTVRQRLREWYYDAPRKRGAKRQALHVETCFAPLLGWVVSWWQGTQLALALDATTLGQRFVVLAISVVYRGCAIPVAWLILPAGAKHAWRREWLRLLRRLRPALPPGWTVIVLADRGVSR